MCLRCRMVGSIVCVSNLRFKEFYLYLLVWFLWVGKKRVIGFPVESLCGDIVSDLVLDSCETVFFFGGGT